MLNSNKSKPSLNIVYLSSILLLFAYLLWEKHQDNERLYKICNDQQDVIVDLQKAINLQKFYINQLESSSPRSYNQLNFNKLNNEI